MAQREDYRRRRQGLLEDVARLDRDRGLELGAGDFQTVDASTGNCEYADYRTTEELAALFETSPDALAPVSHVLTRGEPLISQIDTRFDYIILCHVLEHIANPIGYLQDLRELLTPAGVVLLALPDKRRTLDRVRPSTTLDVLIERHFMKASNAPVSQVMEFARAWLPDYAELANRSPNDFYQWALEQVQSGGVDVHCCVWEDREFFTQMRSLIESQLLRGFSILREVSNDPAHNEFHLVLQRCPEDFEVDAFNGKTISGRSSETRTTLYKVEEGTRHEVPESVAAKMDDGDIELLADALIERIPIDPAVEASERSATSIIVSATSSGSEATSPIERNMSPQASPDGSLDAYLDPRVIEGGGIFASHPLVRGALPELPDARIDELPSIRIGVEGEWVSVDPQPLDDGAFEIPLYAFFDRFDDQVHPLTIEMNLGGLSRSFELHPTWQRDEFIRVASMDTTNTCNLRCAFCIEDQDWRLSAISPENLERVERELFPAVSSDIMLSCLNEPFLHKKFHEICLGLDESDARKAFFTSNMTIPLSDEKIEAVAKTPLKFINVSLDSSDPEIFESMRIKGKISVFEENVRKLSSALSRYDDRELRFGAVITRLNFRTLPQTVEWAQQFKPKSFEFRSLYFANNWAATGWKLEDGILEPDELAWLSAELHKVCDQHDIDIHYEYETPTRPAESSTSGLQPAGTLKTPARPNPDPLLRARDFEREAEARAQQISELSAGDAQTYLEELLVRISATGLITFNDRFCPSFMGDYEDLGEASFLHAAALARQLRRELGVVAD